MGPNGSPGARDLLVWAAVATFIAVPIAAAATSPLLGYRDAVYILGGFAGIVAMSLLLVQPLLAGGLLPGLSGVRGRRVHRWTGGVLVMAVVIHIVALWITSPPDVIDALLLASPTPFSVWGVTAMWAVFASALLAALRRRLRLRPLTWRRAHMALAAFIVLGSVIHAMLIQGTMETMSKAALCVVVLATTAKVIADKGGAARRPR